MVSPTLVVLLLRVVPAVAQEEAATCSGGQGACGPEQEDTAAGSFVQVRRPPPSLVGGEANLAGAQQLGWGGDCLKCARFVGDTCHKCVQDLVNAAMTAIQELPDKVYLGMNGIPADYVIDTATLLGGYPEAFCNGRVEGCRIKENFPGSEVTSIMGWENVRAMVSQTPRKEWSGEWWRGNELGFIINNQFFWSRNNIWPRSILLGATPRQHAAIRPFIEELFTLEKMSGSNVANQIRSMARDFFQQRLDEGWLRVPHDITCFVHQVLSKVALGRSESWKNATRFVDLQAKVVSLATFSQVFPKWVHDRFMQGIAKDVEAYVQEYRDVVQAKFGSRLRAKDAECAPSGSCAWQLASGVWDALYSAGGLSTPTNIATGLGLIYSTHSSSPFKQARSLNLRDASTARRFMWENHRYFAPVVGFPHWTRRPTCAKLTREETDALNKTDGKTEACPMRGDDVNQYKGGKREVPNLALAQLDPEKWGDDAHLFRMRDESEYQEKSQGFAEFAVDNEVEGGAMNRVCPGKSLDLKIGEIFFQVFMEYKGRFKNPASHVRFENGPTWVGEFELERKACRCGAGKRCKKESWWSLAPWRGKTGCRLDTTAGCDKAMSWFGRKWSGEPCGR